MTKREIVRRMGVLIVQIDQCYDELELLERELNKEISETRKRLSKKKARVSQKPRARRQSGLRDRVLDALGRKKMSAKEIALAVGKKRSEDIGNLLTTMVRQGDLVRPSRGIYKRAPKK